LKPQTDADHSQANAEQPLPQTITDQPLPQASAKESKDDITELLEQLELSGHVSIM